MENYDKLTKILGIFRRIASPKFHMRKQWFMITPNLYNIFKTAEMSDNFHHACAEDALYVKIRY